jgi:3-hydroxyisobutyrate dehydrogenase-like beta-hydroxyacid dehydrogenase
LQNWLAKQEHPTPLLVWNRTSAKAHQLSGVTVAESLEEVAKKANIIFTCLLNDKAVLECYDEASVYQQLKGSGKPLILTFVYQKDVQAPPGKQ